MSRHVQTCPAHSRGVQPSPAYVSLLLSSCSLPPKRMMRMMKVRTSTSRKVTITATITAQELPEQWSTADPWSLILEPVSLILEPVSLILILTLAGCCCAGLGRLWAGSVEAGECTSGLASRVNTTQPRKVQERPQKVQRTSRESPEKVLRISRAIPQKVLKKSLDSPQKYLRKSSKSPQKVLGKT